MICLRPYPRPRALVPMGRIYRLRKSPACPSRSASRRSPVPELKHEGCLDAPAAGPKSPTPSLTARRSGRSYRPYIYAATFALLGLSVGKFISLTLIPPALPAPHSPADEMLLSRLNAALEALPITRSLRSQPDVWQEWEAYSSLAPGDKVHRLGPGPMGGSRGLAVQRIFWNEAERKAISILFFGGGLSGWPGVTHGGATAIVMDESLGRVAVRILPAKTGICSPFYSFCRHLLRFKRRHCQSTFRLSFSSSSKQLLRLARRARGS